MKHVIAGEENKKTCTELKKKNLAVYNITASAMAEKFNKIGVRIKEIDLAFSYLNNKNNPKIVELGSGNGREARELIKRTNDYTGVDISEEMVNIARKYVPGENFVVADLETYEFPDDIDAIFAFASLLHSDKKAFINVLKKAYTALNDDGIFLMTLKKGEYGQRVKTDEYGTRYYYFYTPSDIKELTGEKYEITKLIEKESNGQDWMIVILKKK